MQHGFLDRHVPKIRELNRAQRDVMLAALTREMPTGVEWNTPAGGMFLWVRLPQGMDASKLLPIAVEHGVAFVPGLPFYAGTEGDTRTLRLSFVTASAFQIDTGVALLAAAVRAAAP